MPDELKYEVIGVTLLAMAILVLVSIVNPGVGLAGSFINNSLMHLAGEGRFLFPALLAVAGYKMLCRKKKKIKKTVNFYGALIMAVVALTILHLPIPVDYIIKAGWQGDGGGFIGGVTYFILIKSFGKPGVYIILATMFIVGLLLSTNQPLVELFKSITRKMENGVKKTVHIVDDFLFTKDNEAEELPEDYPVIVDRCNDGGVVASDADCDDCQCDAQHKNQIDYTVETPGPEEKKCNVIYYRPVKQPGDNKMMEAASKTGKIISPEQTESKKSYHLPPVSLLAKSVRGKANRDNRDINENIKVLEETLGSFGIKARVIQVFRGPAITRYEIQPPPGVKVSRIVGLSDDIALSMAASHVRIEAPVPGKAVVGIEVPNREIATVLLRELVESMEYQKSSSQLTIALGKDITGKPVLDDLARMPHLLIAGATGAGKSVCLNTMIAGFLFKSTPEQVKFMIIDPKMVELAAFNGIPHLVSPVVTDPKKAATSLRWAVKEMEYRYDLFAGYGVRDIARYNKLMRQQNKPLLPLLVIIIDELADLMMVAPADVEDAICRLAQMARAAGIHLVVATQRPSVDIITGLIKANIPSRISFAVSSQIDSRTILDMGGAEKLLGRGDMLYYPIGAGKPIRVQGAYISDRELELLVRHWKQQAEPEYDDKVTGEVFQSGDVQEISDDMLPLAVKVFVETGHASISLLQRRLHIGYARAARLMDMMEKKGYVGGYEGSKPRAVLITKDEYNSYFYDVSGSQAGNDK
ncbi:FtsK/SpoIIIE family DNA translocase [Desulfallas thermosapovorans]|uniref:DNA translocase FtsK n=1 Tax=Desulfallas thermosapovorans DSM 6562 TaxID=1121431 RepID=A0A5S4ZXP8_9FIRM|nr:DNA translocase FtsK [Desulfallas thermosapovorans]TYO97864.1 DNA translocase FtsK [Desulfallas thermosapovorans DSM 6562]